MEKEKDKNKQNEEKLNFTEAPMRYILMLAGIVIFAFGAIYYIFSQTSIIPAGLRLTRADWLSFIGDYLSFAGTAVVSIIALWQTYHYNKRAEDQRIADRKRDVQPTFSIQFNTRTIKKQIEDEIEEYIIYAIKVIHVGTYPISNIIIFNEFQQYLMMPNDSIVRYVCFKDLADYLGVENCIILTEDSFEKHDVCPDLPKYFNINYDDIDGRKMYQSFELCMYDNILYYSQQEPYEP